MALVGESPRGRGRRGQGLQTDRDSQSPATRALIDKKDIETRCTVQESAWKAPDRQAAICELGDLRRLEMTLAITLLLRGNQRARWLFGLRPVRDK